MVQMQKKTVQAKQSMTKIFKLKQTYILKLRFHNNNKVFLFSVKF